MRIKLVLIVVVSMVLTTLGIGASDMITGTSGSLLSQLIGSVPAVCPPNMQPVPAALTFTCVDTYEASAAPGCVYSQPNSAVETSANIERGTCRSQAVSGAVPWRFVTREQATALCAQSGKRLPTAAEWYRFSLGTKSESCNITSTVLYQTGKESQCVSSAGVFDTVGNVWEWVSDDIIDGTYNGHQIPRSGYILQVDNGGVAIETNTVVADTQFGDDYFWSEGAGAFGMIRGGFYGSQSDGGLYAVQGATKPTFSGAAIGFRCVQ